MIDERLQSHSYYVRSIAIGEALIDNKWRVVVICGTKNNALWEAGAYQANNPDLGITEVRSRAINLMPNGK